ncbi:MAG: hypothetical protein L3K02_00870 [Thermoplasmata archaeon]|nr:hypothetical protein [Thermoplasmata archaeon]
MDEASRGQVKGLNPARESLFADLKRNLVHQDYARYFDSCMVCASVLAEIEGGKYTTEILRDIVEPALATAVEQMESIQKDAARSRDAKRKMQYEPQPSLDQLHLKARPIAVAYPQAKGAQDLDTKYREISDSVRTMLLPES